MTYELEGVLYQFPTPVIEFLNNGWSIPDTYMEQYPEGLPAQEATSIALENEKGCVLYNVILVNQTDDMIALKDCIVMGMLIPDEGLGLSLSFPEGLTFTSSPEELENLDEDGPDQNGSYSSYSWWGEDAYDSIVAAFYHPDMDGIEYFEFSAMW